jgi:PAT family beta-lactamase induction signal transducer AmpG
MGEPEGEPGPSSPAPTAPKRKPSDLAWVASTNFGEGLPWSFIHQMGTDYLTTIRAPIEQVGYTSWLHLAGVLKFLWSPIVDLAGKKRTWMVALQVVLGAGMLVIAGISRGELSSLNAFWIALGALAIVHSTHDIACDGYYLLALNRADQALYAGARVAIFRVATLVGVSVLIVLAGVRSWAMAFAVAAIIMALLGAANALFIPRVSEPSRAEVVKTREARKLRDFAAAYRTFFDQPRIVAVLLFIMTVKLGDIVMFSMAKPMLRDIGISTANRGWLGGPSQIAAIVGTIVSGLLLARWRVRRMLIPIILFMNLVIPLYAVLAWTRPSFMWVTVAVCLEQFAGGMGQTAQQVYLMQRCRRAYAASHYAFGTALTAVGTTVSGAFTGHVYGSAGMKWYFLIAFACGIPSMILAFIVPKTPVESDPGSSL